MAARFLNVVEKENPLCTDQVVLALGNLLLFKNLAMFMLLHLGAQKWSCLYTLSSVSAEDVVNWARHSCLSVILDLVPGTLILLTFRFFPVIEKMAFIVKQYTNAVRQSPPECLP